MIASVVVFDLDGGLFFYEKYAQDQINLRWNAYARVEGWTSLGNHPFVRVVVVDRKKSFHPHFGFCEGKSSRST